ncbi:MAG: hypothetical protein IPQ07_27565 [Myxococcales bacterium]|nr:hypothetical protein [Myxococcales bacterium]
MSWWRRLWWPTTHGEPVARQLARVQPRPFAEFGEGGVVCIAGTVDPLEALLEAPLTGRRCVYWAVTATELRWNLSSYERGSRDQGVPFLLVDGGSRARVIPEGARVAVPFDTRIRALMPVVVPLKLSAGGWGVAEPPVMSTGERALYDSLQIRIMSTSRVRLTEYVIEPEMSIVVQGHAEQEPDDQAAEVGYREAPTRLVVSSARRAPLLVRTANR